MHFSCQATVLNTHTHTHTHTVLFWISRYVIRNKSTIKKLYLKIKHQVHNKKKKTHACLWAHFHFTQHHHYHLLFTCGLWFLSLNVLGNIGLNILVCCHIRTCYPFSFLPHFHVIRYPSKRAVMRATCLEGQTALFSLRFCNYINIRHIRHQVNG